jgi:hypothetical protein
MQAHLPLTLLADIPEHWATAALACRREQLDQIVQAERDGGDWNAVRALRCAHLRLAAGLADLGDDLVLEADALAPTAGLIPDWWGLWPKDEDDPGGGASLDPQDETARGLAGLYLDLRHLPPQPLLEYWRASVTAQPDRLDEPALRLLLGVVIFDRLLIEPSLEQLLAETVGEELVARQPALAFRLFDPLCERLPAWGYARLKAADLALQRGELERCHIHVAAASEEQRQLPWLHDIEARLALARNDVLAALAAWQHAIEHAGSEAEMVELFRQRAREARRGPGVLQARILLNHGDTTAAITLLEALLTQDPQWQPLRSLLEQARPGRSAIDAAAGQSTRAAAANSAIGDDLARLQERLQELAQRAGLPWPLDPANEATSPAVEPDIAEFERFLQTALGRLALLG